MRGRWNGTRYIDNGTRIVALSMPGYYIYIVRCADDSLYTGWTTDIEARVARHNAGKGAKYTRSRLPVILVYSQLFLSQAEAMQREREIKKLSRAEKMSLVEEVSLDDNRR